MKKQHTIASAKASVATNGCIYGISRFWGFDGTDKLTRGHGLALHESDQAGQKRDISFHFELYSQEISARDTHFSSGNKLTCQYPCIQSSSKGTVSKKGNHFLVDTPIAEGAASKRENKTIR
jgi:choline dehydrogenase-like flavoprotein